jgi:DNA topoisomerase-3
MGKALIIAEKPSVAADIARAIGGFKKQADFYESEKYVLSSAVGHLLEIAVPDGQEAKKGKWSLAALPVIPTHFELEPLPKTVSRLKVLLKLIDRKDVSEIINACDAGREGELIFRHIVQYSGTKKPILRLWLQSMTPAAIREGFEVLRKDGEMIPLAEAAVCRSEADWLVGINGTRAMTAFNSKMGGFQLTTVGRVQTPTLAIVVEREEKIRSFVPRTYWELIATFAAQAGKYTGKWFDEKFSKDKSDEDAKAERIWEKEKAEGIKTKCEGKPGEVTETTKNSVQLSPLLFDLTSLQRDANNRFGFSASRTLQIAQALYEKHKAITYPRTDARALPEDYIGTVKKTLEALKNSSSGQFAETILSSDWVKPNKRIFNNAKISDHFAIIPTIQLPGSLNVEENKIYETILKRFLAVFFPPAEYLVTTRITRVEGEAFKSEGKILAKAGWLAIYGKGAEEQNANDGSNEDENKNMPPLNPDEKVNTEQVELKELQTRPAPRFTEATLLTAMEGAGKLLEDDELRAAMSEKGLGTPATRAAIIEGLIGERYLIRRNKELIPTAKAFSLMTLLKGLGIEELRSPELTGQWEFKLKEIEQRRLDRKTFMKEIEEMTRRIVEQSKKYEHDTIPGDFGKLDVACPKCGGEIHENYKMFKCKNCDFSLWKSLAGKQFEKEEIEQLIRERKVGPLDGFRSQKGKTFKAIVKLTDDWKFNFEFENNGNAADKEQPQADFQNQKSQGKCPKCGQNVYVFGRNYVCENLVKSPPACDFRTGTVILQQPIDEEQIKKLLTTGRTDLLTKFISRHNRPFKAYLVLKNGRVEFEFEKQPAKNAPPKKES